ncbi:MAG TPA: FHA domain-containing protein [Chloroflexi bacterium]|nr:FHA domain-containing protein [Chloroflexota bacterium]
MSQEKSKGTGFLGYQRPGTASFLGMPSAQASYETKIEYRVVPADPARHDRLKPGTRPWRIILTPLGATAQPIALEIHGDVVLGSNNELDPDLDVNLAHWRGYSYGVSRRHVMIRPSPHKLFILDLRSTNGTHINGLPLGVGWAYALQDGDLITLGRLQMRVRLIQSPETAVHR